MKQSLLSLLFPNHKDLTSLELRRVILINAFLLIAVIVTTFFGISNLFFFNSFAVGVVDIIGALASLMALIDFRKNNQIERSSTIGTLILFVFFISTNITSKNDNFEMIWTIFFPIFAITLKGHRVGLIYAIVFYALLLIIAYINIGVWQHGEWSFESFMRLAIASFVLVYVITINEIAQFKASQLIQENKEKEQKYIEKLEHLSMTDSLTKLFNRRKIDELLDIELNRAHRYDRDLSLTIFDIDDFKKINDTYGHIVGDKVLIELSQLILNSIRKSDYLGRWGGEEFIIIFPETPVSQAKTITEKLRLIISEHEFHGVGRLTCSFGLAHNYNLDTITTIINNADKALYQAKENGKNIVKVFHENHLI